jgi:epoxyqueuosine reductase
MTPGQIEKNTQLIKNQAKKSGFEYVGISKAEFLQEEASNLEKWLKNYMHGKMHYMENHFDKRLDPTKLVPGAKSVISLLYNYFPQQELFSKNDYKISKYAYGEDYHFVIKSKLKDFLKYLQQIIGEVNGRVFVDSAPVMERAWAKKSGVGWVGKNSLLLTKQRGSFYFLAEIIIDLPLSYDGPIKDYCGSCTRCIDACPTDAIRPYVVDASKCISYLTIELKDEIPQNFKGKMENWIFGCDICQDVCPWNRFAHSHQEQHFKPSPNLGAMEKADWIELTEETFKKLFKKSAIKRTKFEGLKRNIEFVRQEKRLAKD